MQRGPPYSDRPVPRGVRQPAAQQLRAAFYAQEQPVPAPYHTPDGPPVQAHPPPHFEQPVPPHSARREGLDRFGTTSACCSKAATCLSVTAGCDLQALSPFEPPQHAAVLDHAVHAVQTAKVE